MVSLATSHRLVLLAEFYSPIEAQFASYHLQDDGIEVRVLGEFAMTTYGPFIAGSGRLGLHVRQADLEAAREVLEKCRAEWEWHSEESRTADEQVPSRSDAIRPGLVTPAEFRGRFPSVAAPPIVQAAPIVDAPAVAVAPVDDLEYAVGDSRIDRAWKLAIIGLLMTSEGAWFSVSLCLGFLALPIFLCFSLVIVLSVISQGQPISVQGKRRLRLTLWIDLIAILLWAVTISGVLQAVRGVP